MKRILGAAALAGLMAAPALAQAEKVTCGDYSMMDNAMQMETVAELESETSEMAGGDKLTSDQIHDKLAAACKDQVDVLVIDVLKAK